jgi:hypothetical protein
VVNMEMIWGFYNSKKCFNQLSSYHLLEEDLGTEELMYLMIWRIYFIHKYLQNWLYHYMEVYIQLPMF